MNNSVVNLFKIKYRIVQGGMVWVSGYKLASAVSNAGGLGLIGAYWFEPLWLFFIVAILISLPIGVMMLMGKLDYLYSEE